MRNSETLQDRPPDTADRPKDDAQYQPSTRGPEHKRLEVFVGKWKTDGNAYDGPFGSAATISAEETYEWLPGGLFLIHRLQGHLGDDQMACIEIIGYDTSSETYLVRSFYNDGTRNVWQLRERDGIWTFSGDWKTNRQTLHVRCTAAFKDAGRTLTGEWEYSGDGSSWQRFWDTTLMRV
jgi:hypothetical protein